MAATSRLAFQWTSQQVWLANCPTPLESHKKKMCQKYSPFAFQFLLFLQLAIATSCKHQNTFSGFATAIVLFSQQFFPRFDLRQPPVAYSKFIIYSFIFAARFPRFVFIFVLLRLAWPPQVEISRMCGSHKSKFPSYIHFVFVRLVAAANGQKRPLATELWNCCKWAKCQLAAKLEKRQKCKIFPGWVMTLWRAATPFAAARPVGKGTRLPWCPPSSARHDCETRCSSSNALSV